MMNDLIYNLDGNFPLVALCGVIIFGFCLVYRLGKLAFFIFACLALLTLYYEVWPVFTGEVNGVFAQIWASPYLFDKFNAFNIILMIGIALLVVIFYKFQARKLAGVLFIIGIGLYLISEFGYFLESYFIRVSIPYGCIVWLDGDLIAILIGTIAMGTHAIIHRKQQVLIQQINQQFVLQVKEMVRTSLYRRTAVVIVGCGMTLLFAYLLADFLSGILLAIFISLIITLYAESVATEKVMSFADIAGRIIRVRAAGILKGISNRISVFGKSMTLHPQKPIQVAAIEEECLAGNYIGDECAGRQPKTWTKIQGRTIIEGQYETEYESEEERKYAQYVRRRMKENQSQAPKRPTTELLPESCAASNTGKRTINGTINDKEKVGSDSECINAIPFRKSSTPFKVKGHPLPNDWNTLKTNQCTCGQNEEGNPDKMNRAGGSKIYKSDTVGSRIQGSGRIGSDMQKAPDIPKNFLRDVPSDLRDCFADVKNAEAGNDFIAACNILFRITAYRCREFLEIYAAAHPEMGSKFTVATPEQLFECLIDYGEIEGNSTIVAFTKKIRQFHAVLTADPRLSARHFKGLKSIAFALLKLLQKELVECEDEGSIEDDSDEEEYEDDEFDEDDFKDDQLEGDESDDYELEDDENVFGTEELGEDQLKEVRFRKEEHKDRNVEHHELAGGFRREA